MKPRWIPSRFVVDSSPRASPRFLQSHHEKGHERAGWWWRPAQPAKDNGVKLVDGEGNVLGERYEGACEALCNATTAKELHDALDTFEEAIVEDQGNNVAEVKEEEEEKDDDDGDERRFWNRRRSCCIFQPRRESSEHDSWRKRKKAQKYSETTASRFAIEASSQQPMLHYLVYHAESGGRILCKRRRKRRRQMREN